jgi:hypothetical protein
MGRTLKMKEAIHMAPSFRNNSLQALSSEEIQEPE